MVRGVLLVTPTPTCQIGGIHQFHLLRDVTFFLQMFLEGGTTTALFATHPKVRAHQLVIFTVPALVDSLVEPIGGGQGGEELVGHAFVTFFFDGFQSPTSTSLA